MKSFVFRCPNTGLQVHGWDTARDTEDAREMFEAVECLACGQLHMINPSAGKTVGADKPHGKPISVRWEAPSTLQ